MKKLCFDSGTGGEMMNATVLAWATYKNPIVPKVDPCFFIMSLMPSVTSFRGVPVEKNPSLALSKTTVTASPQTVKFGSRSSGDK